MANSLLPFVFRGEANPPFAFSSLHRELDRIFSDFRDVSPAFNPALNNDASMDGNGMLVPKLDVKETKKAINIIAEFPGVEENDIDVSVSGNFLMLTGDKSSDRQDNEKDYRLAERTYGSFARSLQFSFDIDPDAVTAKFDNGELSIIITKPAEIDSQSRKIKISKAK